MPGTAGGPQSPIFRDHPEHHQLDADWACALVSSLIPNGLDPGNTPVSGRIAALAADPTNANTIYIGAAGGGVWKTIDAGTTWSPLTDNQATLSMGAIAVAPSNPNVIYAGTGEADNSLDSFYGRGILKSTDAGATWTLLTGNAGINEFDRKVISRILVNPTDPNTVYVAVAGGGENGLAGLYGLYKSSDGGTTWMNTMASVITDPLVSFTDAVLDPSNPQTLYVAADDPVAAEAESGVYKSTDAGATWSIAGNFPLGVGGAIQLAIAPSAPQTLFAAIPDPSLRRPFGNAEDHRWRHHLKRFDQNPKLHGKPGLVSYRVGGGPFQCQYRLCRGSE